MAKKKKSKKEFSKTLLIQESVLVWITTLVCLYFGYLCITLNSISSLPWVSSIIVSVYTAYGVSQAFYYNKSKAENTANGIKYESVMAEIAAKTTSSTEEMPKSQIYYYSNDNDYQI